MSSQQHKPWFEVIRMGGMPVGWLPIHPMGCATILVYFAAAAACVLLAAALGLLPRYINYVGILLVIIGFIFLRVASRHVAND